MRLKLIVAALETSNSERPRGYPGFCLIASATGNSTQLGGNLVKKF